MPRQNTQLESEGAEFLVLGQLLIEGMAAYKAYTRNRGYGLVATNPETNRAARIQVKSRWATDFDGGFILKDTGNCDFVVFAALNRGYRFNKRHSSERGRKEPDYYVFPVKIAAGARDETPWGKTFLRRVPDLASYERNWGLIRSFLNIADVRESEHVAL